jgi:NAD-dependent SIR2 family protein deacetylase
MFLIPQYRWQCPKCKTVKDAHQTERFPHLGAVPEKCPQCGEQMTLSPIVHRGPALENRIQKKY